MEILIKATQLLASLSILIVLHELGHFIPAKLFKTRVEKFYLFFDPWFSLLKFKKKGGETEYGIGWLPLGGYVKISGMIDESMDKEQMKKDPEPWEFRAKPAWQRLIIMLGGVTVNVILAMTIYAFVLFTWGKTYLPANNAVYGIYCDSLALDVGFRHGDKIVAIDHERIPTDYTYGNIKEDIILQSPQTVTVDRRGSEEIIRIPDDFSQRVISNRKVTLFSPMVPFYADTIVVGNNAEKAGIKKEDHFVAVNGVKTFSFQHFVAEVSKHKGKTIPFTVERNGSETNIDVLVSKAGKIGVGNRELASYFDIKTKSYTFMESIPAGVIETGDRLSSYVSQFKLVFTKEGIQQLGGFGMIGSLFPPTWDWHSFWNLTAFLSIMLAFMNILPIPALDGGHVLFLLYELIIRRKPNEKFMEYAQVGGMLLLLSLLVFANGNDIMRLFN